MLGVCLALIDDEEDRDVFERIYTEYKQHLFILSMRILHNESKSEDAVSETFLSLAKNYKKIHKKELSDIIAYTIIINRNICYQIYNNDKNHYFDKNFDDLSECLEDETFINEIEDMDFVSEIEKLPDIYRDTIMLKYYYEFSVEEISKQFGITLSGVKFRLKTARNIMRKAMNQNE